MTDTKPFDPQELKPAAIGFVVGLFILAGFVLLCLAIGLWPALQFGVPY